MQCSTVNECTLATCRYCSELTSFSMSTHCGHTWSISAHSVLWKGVHVPVYHVLGQEDPKCPPKTERKKTHLGRWFSTKIEESQKTSMTAATNLTWRTLSVPSETVSQQSALTYDSSAKRRCAAKGREWSSRKIRHLYAPILTSAPIIFFAITPLYQTERYFYIRLGGILVTHGETSRDYNCTIPKQ